MKILVTGNLGYIGSVLTEVLIENKIDFVGYDVGYFKECLLEQTNENFSQILKDIRDVDENDLNGIDTIVHLSGLSNDPLGEFNKNLTNDINYIATMKLANLAKKTGVKKFIYVSSQSMYGVADTSIELDEYASDKNPVTEYAKTKWKAEIELTNLKNKEFTITSLRPSTVFGASPRLRCDIVFNSLMASAYTTGKIEIKSDGSPWRPVIHVRDVCEAIMAVLKAPNSIVQGQSYNIGLKDGNYTVRELAEAVHSVLPKSELKFTNENLKDPRTYKVSFNKILTELKEYYNPKWTLEMGAQELLDFFNRINLTENQFRGNITNRLKHLSMILSNKKIDNKFRIVSY